MLNNLILPSAYFGPISYYANIIQSLNPLVEVNEHFIKQTIRNRCYIYGSNGRLRLTIPKKREYSNQKTINKVKICYAEKWQKQHWNAISSSYNSSPYFKYYENDFHHLFEKKEKYLIDFNTKTQDIILKILNYNQNLKTTNCYTKTGNYIDLRNHKWGKDIINKYDQVFMEKYGFITNLSILDLIFNLGPESITYLSNIILNHPIVAKKKELSN